MHPLPPKCKQHKDHQRGCTDCQTYGRVRVARRSRLRAYGQWHPVPRVPVEPVRAKLREWADAGVSAAEIANTAGVSDWAVRRLLLPSNKAAWTTGDFAEKVLNAPIRPPMVEVAGATRRLQALARAGYRLEDLRPFYTGPVRPLREWRRGYANWHPPQAWPLIARSSHLAIVDTYSTLWDTSGPCRWMVAYAANRGWQPFEAWTDATIDDPAAAPFGDSEARQYVDEEKVRRALLPAHDPRRVLFPDLTEAEQLALYRQWLRLHPTSRNPLRRFQLEFRGAWTHRVKWSAVLARLAAATAEEKGRSDVLAGSA